MADIAVTASQVRIAQNWDVEIHNFLAAETITAGQPVYLHTDGKLYVSDANDATDNQCDGIALDGGSANSGISVLKRGLVAGFTLAGNVGSLVYVSNNVGALADAAGTTSLVVGKVVPTAEDGDIRKLLYVDIPWTS